MPVLASLLGNHAIILAVVAGFILFVFISGLAKGIGEGLGWIIGFIIAGIIIYLLLSGGILHIP